CDGVRCPCVARQSGQAASWLSAYVARCFSLPYPPHHGVVLADSPSATVYCDAQAVFDQFGNLFMTYIAKTTAGSPPVQGQNTIELLVGTNGGASFTALPVVDGPGNVDQPSLAVGPGNAPGVGSVWVSWRTGDQNIAVRGAPVTGLGAVGTFTATN